MKPVYFKKWIIIAVVSFILSIFFIIMSVISGGTSMVQMMNDAYWSSNNNMMGDNFWNNGNNMMNDNFWNNDNSMMDDNFWNNDNSMMDDDDNMMNNRWNFSIGDKGDGSCTFSINRETEQESSGFAARCSTSQDDN